MRSAKHEGGGTVIAQSNLRLPLLLLSLWALAFANPVAAAPRMSREDLGTLHAYRPTVQELRKLKRTLEQAAATLEKDPSLAKSQEAATPKDLDDAVRKVASIRYLNALLEENGLTSRDYIMMTFLLRQACAFANTPDVPREKWPASVSPAQVEFCRSHSQEVAALEATYDAAAKASAPEEPPEAWE